MHYIIYKITNLITGRFYIGMHRTKNIDDGYMGSSKWLSADIAKLGVTNFKKEIVHELSTLDELEKKEREIVNQEFIKRTDVYNRALGGMRGWKETVASLGGKANARKWKTDADYRKRFTAAMRDGLKRARNAGKYNDFIMPTFAGHVHTAEYKIKMSAIMKEKAAGYRNSQYGTCWMTKDGKSIKIKKDKLSEFISIGWKRGRVLEYARLENENG